MTVTITIFSLLLIAATVLPQVQISHGAFRYLDFPRAQFLFLILATLPFAVIAVAPPWGFLIGVALAGAAVDQARHIVRFTPLWRPQSIRAEETREEAQVSILVVNVKQSNRAYDRLLRLVDDIGPDIFVALEVDADWVAGLHPLTEGFPERIDRPQDNGYGLVLWSKLPLEDTKVRELLVRDVLSVRTTVRLRDGRPFALFVLHPEPPVPSHDTDGRDAEIGLVGIETTETPLPSVVTGDLNDVAWSGTTRRFQRLSGLLDPRVGRGLYASFDARFAFLRWPLDHMFHDPRFRLVSMARLPDVGSDHFPMTFTLQLAEAEAQGEKIEEERPEDKAEIREMAAKEAREDRNPIGGDWEV
ncbi:MAG: endonuclease/exonuclease/phosphatase family protein [Proteobacteria bacterium]|nr:endonuclease/exonuclease/phosphatase family protein [Pseudomonadota bacterium]